MGFGELGGDVCLEEEALLLLICEENGLVGKFSDD